MVLIIVYDAIHWIAQVSASKIVITLNKEGLNMTKNIKLKPNKYLPVYVDGVGEVETKPNEIEVAYKGELVRFFFVWLSIFIPISATLASLKFFMLTLTLILS